VRQPDAASGPPAQPSGADDGTRAARQLVSRLAVVAVQGEQLRALCGELEAVLDQVRRDPRLQAPAATLAAVLAEVSGVARDIELVTETLGEGLQRRGGRRGPGEDGGAGDQTAVSVPRKA
jgi:hypothetical protein